MNEEKEKQNDDRKGCIWKKKRTNYGYYMGIVCAALAYFYPFLSGIGFFPSGRPTWGDETFTVRLINESWSGFWEGIISDVHPPLYFFCVKLFNIPFEFLDRVFKNIAPNISLDSPRLISLLFYLILIGVLVLISWNFHYEGKKDRIKLLVISCIFIACSAHLFLFGPMIRYYILNALIIFSISVNLILPESFNPNIRPQNKAVQYGKALFFALATSYMSAVVIPAHIIYLLSRPREESRPYFKSLMWVGVASIPLIALMVYQMRGMYGGTLAGPGALAMGFIARLFFTLYSFSIGEFIRPWDFILSIPAFISVAYLLYLAWRMRKTALGSLSWLMLSISLPLGVLVLTVIHVGVEFSASRLTFIAPMFLLLLGLAPLYSKNKIEKIAGTTAVIVLIILNCLSSFNYIERTNYIQSTYIIPWTQIADDAESNMTSDADGSMVLSDDDTFQYWLGDDTNPIPIHNLFAIDTESDLLRSNEITRIMVVYSPKNFSDDYVFDLVRTLSGREPVLFKEIDYLREDENSMRWKSMLLGRQVEEVKKKLIIYNVAGESSENQ